MKGSFSEFLVLTHPHDMIYRMFKVLYETLNILYL